MKATPLGFMNYPSLAPYVPYEVNSLDTVLDAVVIRVCDVAVT